MNQRKHLKDKGRKKANHCRVRFKSPENKKKPFKQFWCDPEDGVISVSDGREWPKREQGLELVRVR